MGKLPWLCWMFLLVGGVVGSAQQSNNAVSSLKARYAGGAVVWALKIDGVHATTAGLIPQTVVRIVNGQVQVRQSSDNVRRPDDVMLPAGTLVRVADLESVGQPTIDVLRIKFMAGNGRRGAVAILLAKGTLDGMSDRTLDSLIASVLENKSSTAVTSRVLPKERPNDPIAVPAPQWRIHPVQQDNQKGMAASLNGVVTANGKTQPALLTVRCTKGTSPEVYPAVTASANLQVRPEMVTFETGHMEDKAAYHDNAGRSQLDNLPEIHMDIDAETTDRGIRVFGLSYDEPDLKAMIEAAGSRLKLTVMPEKPGKENPLTAEFQLPVAGGVLSMMSSCFDMLEAQEAKQREKNVVSCPSVAGKVLKDMKVLTGSSGKELERDIESDQERSWILPHATKTQSRPRLSLACFYGEPGYRSDQKDVLEKRVLPIPAIATGCVVADSSTENRNHGECTR